jgi:D-aminopeptidase
MSTTQRLRLRQLGISPGVLPTGPSNSITDIADLLVGHCTVIEGDDVRTGVTAIRPHSGNIYQDRVPVGLCIGNGYGKLSGVSQMLELGEIETPILLTNTLAVPRAADALIDYTLGLKGNEAIRSLNTVVGECNDGFLNNIQRRVISREHVFHALESASNAPVAEGCVGGGTGMVAFGWKGGIGSSSRKLPAHLGGFTVGALVQSNYGGVLSIAGQPIGIEQNQYFLRDELDRGEADGSIMIILATDAPLSDRNLTRLARRAMTGLARTGAAMTDSSGDYALAFSTAESVRRTAQRRSQISNYSEISNEQMSPLFLAAIEATEEAIYNSLCMATTTIGHQGRIVHALPLDAIKA